MKAIVHVSGGLDSAASLLLAYQMFGPEIMPVYYDWGQLYLRQEWVSAQWIVKKLLLNRPLVRFDIMLWTDESFRVPEYVPFRNLVLCSHSVALAAARHTPYVVTGSKSVRPRADDPYSFRDSTLDPFTSGLNNLVSSISESGMTTPMVCMPLAGWSKTRTVKFLMDNKIDPDGLWTCYRPGVEPCGECHHCKEYKLAKVAIEGRNGLSYSP